MSVFIYVPSPLRRVRLSVAPKYLSAPIFVAATFCAVAFTCIPAAPCEFLLLDEITLEPATRSLIQESVGKAISSGHLRIKAGTGSEFYFIRETWGSEIILPRGQTLEENPGLALQALVGLPEHPYTSVIDPRLIRLHKSDHTRALQAFLDHARHHDKGLLVAPPGFGKSLFAREFLASRLKQDPGGLHLVIADYRLAIGLNAER
jgi:hypothetical protein